jgi:hypothetical protein
MYKIVGGDQKEYGPINADELRQWIDEGRLNGQSLVKAEDTAEWRPLSTFSEFTDALKAQAATALPTAASAPGTTPTEAHVDVSLCLRAGLGFLMHNAGFVFGAVLAVWLLNLMLRFAPIIGVLAHLLLSGVLYGGLYFAVLERLRGHPAVVGDVFAGFKRGFVQLVLAGVLTRLLTQIGFLFCVLPGIYLTVAWVFTLPLVVDKRLEFWSAMELSRKVVTRIWFRVCLLLALLFLPVVAFHVFSIIQMGSIALGMMREVDFDWSRFLELMQERNRELARMTVTLTLKGQAILLVNLLYAVGGLMQAYEDLFGTRQPPSA